MAYDLSGRTLHPVEGLYHKVGLLLRQGRVARRDDSKVGSQDRQLLQGQDRLNHRVFRHLVISVVAQVTERMSWTGKSGPLPLRELWGRVIDRFCFALEWFLEKSHGRRCPVIQNWRRGPMDIVGL